MDSAGLGLKGICTRSALTETLKYSDSKKDAED